VRPGAQRDEMRTELELAANGSKHAIAHGEVLRTCNSIRSFQPARKLHSFEIFPRKPVTPRSRSAICGKTVATALVEPASVGSGSLSPSLLSCVKDIIFPTLIVLSSLGVTGR
jgi:hypothetical protein